MTAIQDAMPQRISMGIDLTGRVEKCEGYYVSLCNELPLIGMGATPEDAMRNFTECFEEYIRLSVEWGVIDKVAEDYGLNISRASVSVASDDSTTWSLPGVVDLESPNPLEAPAMA